MKNETMLKLKVDFINIFVYSVYYILFRYFRKNAIPKFKMHFQKMKNLI